MMNFYDHIKTYNQDETRPVSEGLDRAADRERFRKWGKFLLGMSFLLAWGLFWAYVLWGWLA